MKLFLDTADVTVIRKWAETGLIDGVTTNPTHLAQYGKNPTNVVKEIGDIMPYGDVSVEITEKEPKAVYEQALAIAGLGERVTVKVPCHADYYSVIKSLVDEGIRVNITLVFTLIQGLFMCKLGVRYISPFIGRWDDIDVDGIQLIYELRQMIDDYAFDTQVLAASIRTVRHFHEVIETGADVVTVPLDVLEKATKHPLTDRGMEKFLADWQKLGIKQFP